MHIRKVISANQLRACRRFLVQDPIANVLPLGDLYTPLLQVSDVYSAVKDNQVVGVCAIYRAYPMPSIVFGAAESEVKQHLVQKAVSEVSSEFISLCQPNDAIFFKEHSTILHSHSEYQMVADPPRNIDCGHVKVEKVGRDDLELLSKFYANHQAEAWVPIQFEAGPYYCVKHDSKIVSAAGVHLVTPRIAQLGNIVTDEAYRNRDFATACTNILAADLASKGRTVSLFVRMDNTPAIHIYEKLGFSKARKIAFLVMRKSGA
ncbi:MAG: GNAT family N-acetyltransferase [Candidatus Bathyarchaeota archaeon]|nr:GNAT family N-acetyltransferase [Candidatus Bathyarchaeota archaeon]